MKGVHFFSLLIALSLLAGCAVAEQDAGEIGQQFQDGLQGRGRIVPNDPTSDSFGDEYR
ncbi:MAG: hypothetical protein SFU53_06505 [Terrimicrobiaceae bacterium]|nr:hypothetical protein [Terrimicrobiaceae bacterium]